MADFETLSSALPLPLPPPPEHVTFNDLSRRLEAHLASGGSDYESFYREYSDSDKYFVFIDYDEKEKIKYGSLDDFFCTIDIAPKDYHKLRFHICLARLMRLLASRDRRSLEEYTTIIRALEARNREDFLLVVVALCKIVANITGHEEKYGHVFWPSEPVPKLAHLFEYDLAITLDAEAWAELSTGLDEEVRTVFAKVLSPLSRVPSLSEVAASVVQDEYQ